MQNLLLCISIALIAGLLMSRVAKRVGLPAVTAYLVTGLLLGPFILGRLQLAGIGFHNMEEVAALGIIPDTGALAHNTATQTVQALENQMLMRQYKGFLE